MINGSSMHVLIVMSRIAKTLCRSSLKTIPRHMIITRFNLFCYVWRRRKFVREMLASIGVLDTANYFAKELDLFDTTVCMNTELLLFGTFKGFFNKEARDI